MPNVFDEIAQELGIDKRELRKVFELIVKGEGKPAEHEHASIAAALREKKALEFVGRRIADSGVNYPYRFYRISPEHAGAALAFYAHPEKTDFDFDAFCIAGVHDKRMAAAALELVDKPALQARYYPMQPKHAQIVRQLCNAGVLKNVGVPRPNAETYEPYCEYELHANHVNAAREFVQRHRGSGHGPASHSRNGLKSPRR